MTIGLLRQITDPILNSPKLSIAIPFVTAILANLQGLIAFISMCIGMFISLLILRHWWITNLISQIQLDRLIKEEKNENLH